jgi:hypothetical protein
MRQFKIFGTAVVLFGVLLLAGCGGGGGGGGGGAVVTTTTGSGDNSGGSTAGNLTITPYHHLRAVSMPVEIAEAGVVAAALAQSSPDLNASVLRSRISASRKRFPLAVLRVTQDAANVFTLFASNYSGQSDYDPTDPQGEQTLFIKYVNGSGQVQKGPDADTVKIEITGTGKSDYGLLRYENNTMKYSLTIGAGSSWTTATAFRMVLEESSTAVVLSSTYAFARNLDVTIDASSGMALTGEGTDTLTTGATTYSAVHKLAYGNCQTTYSGYGQPIVENETLPNYSDSTRNYSWINPITGNTEYLTVNFNGKAMTARKCDNDRLNVLYIDSYRATNETDLSQSAFAKVFQHACQNDEVADMIIGAAQQAYPNDPINQLNYAIGFETKGLGYQTDDQTFGEGEYVSVPTVTLYNQIGDCEDRAILLGAILHKLGFDVSLILFQGPNGGHALVGLSLPNELQGLVTSGAVGFPHQGKTYYCLEATNYAGINEYRPHFESERYSLWAIIPPYAGQSVTYARMASNP